MRNALLLLVGLGIGCGSNMNAAQVELVVTHGRRAPRLDRHPTIDRTRAAVRTVCGHEVPIRFELLGIRPESFAVERAVEELEGVAAALETLTSQPAWEPLRDHVCQTLVAIVVTHVFPPPSAREVHFGVEPSPRDARERSPDGRGVLRVFWAPAPMQSLEVRAARAQDDVLNELRRAHSIARARRFATVEPMEVPREALVSYVAYLDDVGRQGVWTLEGRAPQRRLEPGQYAEVLERALRVYERFDDDAAAVRADLERLIFWLADVVRHNGVAVPPSVTAFVRARWSALGKEARLHALQQVIFTTPDASSKRSEAYGIPMEEWIPKLLREIHHRSDVSDRVLCASHEPTCERDHLARFVARHPPLGSSIVQGLAASPALLGRFFGSALVVPRSRARPEFPWGELLRALDDGAQLVAARALADASRTTGHAPHALEASVAVLYSDATAEVRVELLRLLAQHSGASDSEPSGNGPATHAEAAELGLLLRHPYGGLDALARVLRFAADDVDVIAIVGLSLERFLLGHSLHGQSDEDEARAWFRVMDATVQRFGLRGGKWFADFLHAQPHAKERRLVVQRWLAALSRVGLTPVRD